jgi:hypothetical protein
MPWRQRLCVRGTPGDVPWPRRPGHAHTREQAERRFGPRRRMGRRRRAGSGRERRGRVDPGRRCIDAGHGSVSLRGDHPRRPRTAVHPHRAGVPSAEAAVSPSRWPDSQCRCGSTVEAARPVRLPVVRRWAPIATTESWQRQAACNAFSYRSERLRSVRRRLMAAVRHRFRFRRRLRPATRVGAAETGACNQNSRATAHPIAFVTRFS